MKIQGKTIEFDSDGWKVTELSDGRLKVEHNTSGETYHFSDAGELQASSLTAGSLNADSAVIAQELGLPEYDDVANAPQMQGRLVYATGNGTSVEGIYKHDGSSYAQVGGESSQWQEDGSGNIVPIDGETIGDGTTSANHQSVDTDDAQVANAPSANTDVARKTEVDGKADDPHANAAHSLTFVSDGDGTERQIWVIANGASDPAGADPEDIIFEEQ